MTVNMKPLLSSRVLDLRITLADDSVGLFRWNQARGVYLYYELREKIMGVLAGREVVA